MDENVVATELAETPQEQAVVVHSIEAITAEILLYKQQAGTAILEIGRRLIEAKDQLSHGEWLPWLEEKVEFSEATAQRFMRLAREYTNPSLVTDLGASKALVLLALPASERDKFLEEKHTVNGEEKSVIEMSRRELETAIKERDEAQRQVEQLKTDMAAKLEEQRTAYNEGMTDIQGRLDEAENRAKGYAMKLQEQKDRAAEDLAKAEGDVAALKAQLEELLAAPQSVAVEKVVDQDAVNTAAAAARQETEQRLKVKIEKAEKAREKAEKAKAEAEQNLAALKVSQEQADAIKEQERKTLEEQVRALRKQLAVASSSEMTIFKLHFEQAQGSINKMTDCITRMTDGGDAEGAEKLKNAFRAMLSTTLEVLG